MLIIPLTLSGQADFQFLTTTAIVLPGLFILFCVGFWWRFWGREFWSERLPRVYGLTFLLPITAYLIYAWSCFYEINEKGSEDWMIPTVCLLLLAWVAPVIASLGRTLSFKPSLSRMYAGILVFALMTPYVVKRKDPEISHISTCSKQQQLMKSFPFYYPAYYLVFRNRVCNPSN